MLTDNERQQLLAEINAVLAERNLKPLPKLGDHSKGEFEIVRIKEIYDHSKRFFTDVKFTVLLPSGDPGEFTVRFNANGLSSDGAVFVTLVNGKFAIVKQWRPSLGRWMYEVPRGFGEKLDNARIAGQLGTIGIGDLPLGTLVRELGEEVMAGAKVTSLTHLANIAQDSGTHSATPSYFLVMLQVPEAKLSKGLKGSDDEVAKVKLWDTETVRAEIGQRLCDNHTITALCLALNHIQNLPRLA
ncbi:MAG TPA: NUDIX domain-containing protein [Candidatus Eisenbacteria bacterium]|jgi:hypothetical protein|nr:NUDIX domain-containing protein [Candidatus Eisenbacteria bacterium]